MDEMRKGVAEKKPEMTEPTIKYSVLISLYAKESESNFRECIESVLSQTIAPDEIVIVKDGLLNTNLNNALNSYVTQYPDLFHVIGYEKNKGLWHALNIGVPECRNDVIMRMDSDDICVSNRAESLLSVISMSPDIGCVGSNVIEFAGSINNPISFVKLPETDSEIIKFGRRRCPYRHPALMYRKNAVMNAGNYQPMPLFEDYDLYMRLARTGCVFYNVQESLVYMRVSPDFYMRRGGVGYMKKMLSFKTTCLKRGDINIIDYLASVIPHVVVCLLPNNLRTGFYKRFLRAGVPNGR